MITKARGYGRTHDDDVDTIPADTQPRERAARRHVGRDDGMGLGIFRWSMVGLGVWGVIALVAALLWPR